MPLQDDYMFVSEPQVVPSQHEEQPQVIETSEETASASVRQRARPASKVIPLDTTMELHNGDLARWGTQYLANMEEALRPKNAAKAAAQAKKNAEFWMLGQSDVGPLSLFQGAQFLEAVTGINIGSGNKRVRDEGYETDETRRVRPRVGDLSSDELARGMEFDDGFMPMFGDDTIEQGRDVPTPLDEGHLSSMMPWNQSAGSRRPTALFSGAGQAQPTSASFGGAGLQLTLPARRGSRLTTESPLQGRSVPMPLGDQGDFQFPDSQADVGMTDAEEYELYGPAANVDTQTAAQSQWQRAALDGESVNFLGFVKAGIEELDIAREGASPGNEEDETLQGSIDFDGLLPPRSNTCIVAAQALLHVLSLGTKNLLRVEQEEAFGTITLRPIVQI